MIAAKENRQRAGFGDLVASAAQYARPALDFAVVIGFVRGPVCEVSELDHREIAVINDIEIQALELCRKSGGAERRRAHQGTALRSPHVDGSAEQGDAPGSIRRGSIGHSCLLRSARLSQPNRDSHPSFHGGGPRRGGSFRNKSPRAELLIQGRYPP